MIECFYCLVVGLVALVLAVVTLALAVVVTPPRLVWRLARRSL